MFVDFLRLEDIIKQGRDNVPPPIPESDDDEEPDWKQGLKKQKWIRLLLPDHKNEVLQFIEENITFQDEKSHPFIHCSVCDIVSLFKFQLSFSLYF